MSEHRFCFTMQCCNRRDVYEKILKESAILSNGPQLTTSPQMPFWPSDSLSDRTRSRRRLFPGCSQRKSSWNSERLQCNGSSEDPQGSEFPSLYSTPNSILSEQPDHSTSSTCTQEKSEKSSEKLQCNGDGTVRKEDVCSVILLQKSGDFRVNKMTTDQGLFHEGANVFQIFWTEASVTWTSTDEGHAMIQTVRQSLVNKTESRGVSCPGSPAGGGR